jgi:hypothetical protein
VRDLHQAVSVGAPVHWACKYLVQRSSSRL